jgi:glycosyltransferase involved in cell wall biosynthesis
MPPAEARRRLQLPPDTLYLNFTGSMKAWHDIETVIRAMPVIIDAFPRCVRLMIVGDGPQRKMLKKLARDLGVEGAIEWVGTIPAREVPLYINSAEICLAPFTKKRNTTTGLCPLKVLEYMSCGRPFVMSRSETRLDRLISDLQCASLVPPGDPELLARAVIDLLDHPERKRQLGENGRKAACRLFDWDGVVNRIEQFIR